MWLRHRPSRPDRWVALLVLLASIAAAAGQSTPCPANSDGEGDGMECICEEGYEGRITYNDAETPPTYEGACERVKTDYFLGMGTGFLMGVILLAISALAFNIAGKTSFECSMLTNLGLGFFWLLCIIFVAYAPREGELGLTETDEIDVMWWPRFILSILLYGGSLVALLAYVKDVVFFTVDRKTRVVVR